MIRRMQVSDLPAIAKLEKKYFSVPWSEHSLKQSLGKSEYLFLVASEEGEAVGYGCILKVFDEGNILNIVVDERFRGGGIGRELVRELLEEGKRQGMRAFTLEVRVSNVPAIRLYESLGFVSEGIRKHFYEKPVEDALIMWKREP